MPAHQYGGLQRLMIVLIFAVAALWRLPATTDEWRLIYCESDSLFQLHRVQHCLQRYPLVQAFDAYAHYPRGYRVVWMHPHTVLYATVAKVARIPADDLDAIARFLSWIPPLLGLVTLSVTLAVARAWTASRWCVLAVGLLCAVSPEVARPFLFGIIDHHLYAHLGVMLLVLGRARRSLRWWLLGLAALLAMTPEAIIYASLMLGCVCVADVAALLLRSADRPPLSWFWYVSAPLVAALSMLIHRLVAIDPGPLLDLTWTYPTLFQATWLALLAIGLRAVVGVADGGRRGGGIRVAAAAAALILLCLVFLYGVGALESVLARLSAGRRLFVGEEAFVFRAGFWTVPAAYRILAFAGLFYLSKLVSGVYRRSRADEWFQWVVLSVACLIGFSEFRHLYVLASLQLIGVALAAFEIERVLRQLRLFSGSITRAVPAGVLALSIVPFMLGHATRQRAALGDVCDRLPVVETITRWLARHTPPPSVTAETAPSYGVFTPWSIGHHIHVLGQRPVVVDPFNFELDRGIEDAIEEVLWSATADDLVRSLREDGVRYLALTNPSEEIVGVATRRRLPAEDFVAVSAAGAVRFLPAMQRFAAFRLFMSSGVSGEWGHFQPRLYSDVAETYVSKDGRQNVAVPAAQVYELKAGAVITGTLAPGETDVTVSYTIDRGAAGVFAIRTPVRADATGRFRFHTALPAPVEESSFRVPRPYQVSAGGRHAAVEVTQAMVDTGTVVEVSWTEAATDSTGE